MKPNFMHPENETEGIGGRLKEPSYLAISLGNVVQRVSEDGWRSQAMWPTVRVMLLHSTHYILATCRLSSLWYT